MMTEEYNRGYKQGREDAAKDVRTACFVLGTNVASFSEFLALAAENNEEKNVK
jgi:hypothetical protein